MRFLHDKKSIRTNLKEIFVGLTLIAWNKYCSFSQKDNNNNIYNNNKISYMGTAVLE